MKLRYVKTYMNMADEAAELSYCERRQVGCVIVTLDDFIAIGYNGTPPGWDNCCEGEDGLTKPHVLHAERNALGKITRGPLGARGATLFVNYPPCYPCAVEISIAEIAQVYYKSADDRWDGVNFLDSCAGISVSDYNNLFR